MQVAVCQVTYVFMRIWTLTHICRLRGKQNGYRLGGGCITIYYNCGVNFEVLMRCKRSSNLSLKTDLFDHLLLQITLRASIRSTDGCYARHSV